MTRVGPDSVHEALLAAAKELPARGLVEGTAGNVSARRDDGNIVMTPSSVDYEDMELSDLVVMDAQGEVLSCKDGRHPSSERMLHLACYEAFDDIASVIHTHPVHATMFAVAHQDIPVCIDEFAMYVGGDVRCSTYAPSGSAELGAQVTRTLRDRGAALIANHGLVAVGPDPGSALHISSLVERCAQIVWGARILGDLHAVPGDVNELFARHYFELRSKSG